MAPINFQLFSLKTVANGGFLEVFGLLIEKV